MRVRRCPLKPQRNRVGRVGSLRPGAAGGAQVANPDFFLKTLPLFDAGDDVGMVLSPQCFHNIDAHADIFNHGNVQFWEYAQVGYDAIGFISCTGARPGLE